MIKVGKKKKSQLQFEEKIENNVNRTKNVPK